MAPKRRGTLYGGRIVTEKRTARRPAREPSPDSSSTSSASTPSAIPGPSSAPIDTLAGRIITMGRKVDFGFFEDEGFSIGRQIKELGWDKVCSLDVPTYPALVKEFYLNLSRGDGGLVSSVRNKRICLSAEILGNLLSIPVVGAIACFHNDRAGALSRMMGRDFTEFEEVRANQLPLELRLLHNICSRILFPKTGRFEYVSERDILIMDCILTGQPLNLAGMIIGYMAEASTKKRWSLPYGMILTEAFKSQGVVISDNEPKKTLRHTDYYSLATVHRMGFVKVNGRWERKANERVADIGASAEAGPSVRHSSPEARRPSPSPAQTSVPAPVDLPVPSSGFLDLQLEQLKQLFANHEDRMKLEIENKMLSMKEMLYSLEDRIKVIESSLGSNSEALKNELLNIFEKIKDIAGDSDTYSKCNAELQEKIIVASNLVQKMMTDFMKTQKEGMGQILEELKRKFRFS